MGTGAFRRADRADFDAAFVALFRKAYLAAYRLLGNAEEAEDAAAEALARALAGWSTVRTLPYRDAWVTRVAANLALDRLRQRRRISSVRPAPDADSVDVAIGVDLAEALKKLPRRQREVIVLRYVADLSEHEVAETLGVSPETVKEHAARGRTSLRTVLGPEFMGAMSWS